MKQIRVQLSWQSIGLQNRRSQVRSLMRVIELVPKRPKGVVCKTTSRGFESHPVLLYMWTLAERFNALDCGSRVHQFESGTPTYMVRSSNGQDSWFSFSKQEFDSPTNLLRKAVITGSRPDLKSGVPQGIERSSRSVSGFGELAQWLMQRTVNPPIQVRFLYSPFDSPSGYLLRLTGLYMQRLINLE